MTSWSQLVHMQVLLYAVFERFHQKVLTIHFSAPRLHSYGRRMKMCLSEMFKIPEIKWLPSFFNAYTHRCIRLGHDILSWFCGQRVSNRKILLWFFFLWIFSICRCFTLPIVPSFLIDIHIKIRYNWVLVELKWILLRKETDFHRQMKNCRIVNPHLNLIIMII